MDKLTHTFLLGGWLCNFIVVIGSLLPLSLWLCSIQFCICLRRDNACQLDSPVWTPTRNT